MQKTSKRSFLYLGKFLWKGSPEGRLETKILENAVRRGGSPKWKAEKVKGFLHKVNTQKSFFSKIWAKTKNDGDHFDFAFWPKFWKKTFFEWLMAQKSFYFFGLSKNISPQKFIGRRAWEGHAGHGGWPWKAILSASQRPFFQVERPIPQYYISYSNRCKSGFFSKFRPKSKMIEIGSHFRFWPKFWKKTFFEYWFNTKILLLFRAFNLEKRPREGPGMAHASHGGWPWKAIL